MLCLPLFHMHGLGVGLHGTLTVGASAVLLAGFSPEAVFDAAREHDATLFFGVPTMYTRLARARPGAGARAGCGCACRARRRWRRRSTAGSRS